MSGVSPLLSKRVNKLLQAHARLPQHALQSFGQDALVVRNGYAACALHHADMRAFLSHGFKAKPLKGFHGVAAGNVAWQFHAVARTGSLTK